MLHSDFGLIGDASLYAHPHHSPNNWHLRASKHRHILLHPASHTYLPPILSSIDQPPHAFQYTPLPAPSDDSFSLSGNRLCCLSDRLIAHVTRETYLTITRTPFDDLRRNYTHYNLAMPILQLCTHPEKELLAARTFQDSLWIFNTRYLPLQQHWFTDDDNIDDSHDHNEAVDVELTWTRRSVKIRGPKATPTHVEFNRYFPHVVQYTTHDGLFVSFNLDEGGGAFETYRLFGDSHEMGEDETFVKGFTMGMHPRSHYAYTSQSVMSLDTRSPTSTAPSLLPYALPKDTSTRILNMERHGTRQTLVAIQTTHSLQLLDVRYPKQLVSEFLHRTRRPIQNGLLRWHSFGSGQDCLISTSSSSHEGVYFYPVSMRARANDDVRSGDPMMMDPIYTRPVDGLLSTHFGQVPKSTSSSASLTTSERSAEEFVPPVAGLDLIPLHMQEGVGSSGYGLVSMLEDGSLHVHQFSVEPGQFDSHDLGLLGVGNSNMDGEVYCPRIPPLDQECFKQSQVFDFGGLVDALESASPQNQLIRDPPGSEEISEDHGIMGVELEYQLKSGAFNHVPEDMRTRSVVITQERETAGTSDLAKEMKDLMEMCTPDALKDTLSLSNIGTSALLPLQSLGSIAEEEVEDETEQLPVIASSSRSSVRTSRDETTALPWVRTSSPALGTLSSSPRLPSSSGASRPSSSTKPSTAPTKKKRKSAFR